MRKSGTSFSVTITSEPRKIWTENYRAGNRLECCKGDGGGSGCKSGASVTTGML